MTVQERYTAFVLNQVKNPTGGTAPACCRALKKLNIVFQEERPSWVRNLDLWEITDPAEIMGLYHHVLREQNKFLRGTGIFAEHADLGKSYFKNFWCSSALKFYAQFRASQGYDVAFDDALASSNDGTVVALNASKIELEALDSYLPDEINVSTREGKEIVAEVKQRIGQGQFRKWILGIYGGRCCMTGLDVYDVLRASHIVAWACDIKNRMNPSNGLCLSATYDAAFDRHLISFDEDYRLILSKDLKDVCTRQVHADYFLSFEGKQMMLPRRFIPDQKLLARHRELLRG